MNVLRDTDHGARSLLERVRRLGASKAVVRVGILDDAPKTSEDGASSQMSLVEVGYLHEFGAPAAHIPQRSFIRGAVDAKHGEIIELQKKLAAQVLKGTVTEEVALDRLGLKIVGWVQGRMSAGLEPPLAPTTIARRPHGGTKPLVDTGQLKSGITSQVVNGGA